MRRLLIPSLFVVMALTSACSNDPVEGDGTPTTDASVIPGDANDVFSNTATDTDPLCVDVECTDGNPCTSDNCVEGSCVFTSQKDLRCDDDNQCTEGDRCQNNGTCVGETATLCEDENVCTSDLCHPESGCVFEPVSEGQGCVDGDPCSQGDICMNGICAGIPKTCPDDGNPCTLNTGCDSLTGDCLMQIVPDGSTCNDDNACTSDDICSNGICTPTSGTICDDANPCTNDTCTPKGGCVFTPNIKSCDDDDICTITDSCQAGQCLGVLLDCEDGNECTDAKCVSDEGCVYDPIIKPCEDGSPCTLGDMCAAGQCTSGDQKACDDNNVCTFDTCDPNTGACHYTAHESPCEDGNGCTEGDFCVNTSCVGGATKNCQDNNACTDDLCDVGTGSCLNTPNNTPCQDGNPCTLNDSCTEGACQGGSQKSCNDGNACTTEYCDLATGNCIFTYNQNICDDNDLCTTQDVCLNGVCAGVPDDCDDGNECTQSNCDSVLGCVDTPLNKPCGNDNACITTGVCEQGVCIGSEPISCDDGNECTGNICDPISGCSWTSLTGTLCQDGNACTEADTCEQSVCIPGPPAICDDDNPCTIDAGCDSETGCIQTNLPGIQCDTGLLGTCGLCTVQGSGILCLPSAMPPCDDDNVCTDDIYVCSAEECFHLPSDLLEGTPCDDGNACTKNDACTGVVCTSGAALECNDDNPCTTDACNPSSGCMNIPNTEPCNDGSVCTLADQCFNGICNGGNPIPCDDDNPCTDDVCEPLTGCLHFDNVVPCDDDNACTLGDQCTGGLCMSGVNIPCSDGLFCNGEELCNPTIGCVAGQPPELEDGIDCTIDGCFELTDEVLHLPDDSACEGDTLCVEYACNSQFGCVEAPATFCCGNGEVEVTEACDDENLDVESCAYGEVACLVCGPECQLVPGKVSFCGDEEIDIEAGEVCDDGYADACGFCNADCTEIGSGAVCGDGVVCPQFEECDDGYTNVCGDCNADCTGPGITGFCGDGEYCPESETCDDGYNDECGTCNSDCSGPGTGALCGDGIICPQVETCDDGYTDECGTCNADCSDFGSTAICGDLAICVELEVCDDGNNLDSDSCSGNCSIDCGAIKGGHVIVPQVILIPETNVTLEGWFRADIHLDSHLFRYSEDCSQEVTVNLTSAGTLIVKGLTGAGIGWGGPFPLGEWTHVAVTFASGTASIHINGEIKANAAMLVGANNTCDLGIGGRIDTHDFDFPGAIDQVRVSNKKIYSANFYPDPVLAPVPETFISLAFNQDFGTFAEDDSGQGNHGTLENSYWFAAGAGCVDQLCGNGTLDLGEQCDDANGFAGDTCSPKCLTEVIGIDCDDILLQNVQATSGIYYVDPDENGPEAAFQVFCEMTMEGGGWTLVAVSSDDGDNTWTWNNRHLWDTNTLSFGSMGGLNKDFKSPGYHKIAVEDIAFIHAPSGIWASYHDVGDGVQPMSAIIENIGDPVCWAPEEGYPLNAGTLANETGLCSTALFLSPRDHDGNVDCPGNANTYGPAWSVDNGSGGCPLDDPGYASSLGPNESDPDVEYLSGSASAVGFAASLSLNTGDAETGENHMQIFVRRSLASYCGNGTIEEGESCDDDNGFDGDGCSSDCTVEFLP